ncbi:MAG: RNA 3'-phosphate cyclase [Candidatus Cloacimonetes bacterium 4572_55]|nr:MAG: RNA 3'-phosphate cyclase [Candidatus Cloacimonetes bacterium 4572_55]
MLEVDGSFGEGGGQILRTTLALSVITEIPVRIYNIRGRRPRPGLRPQHALAARALAEISRGKVRGADPGSEEVIFEPKKVKSNDYVFDIAELEPTSGSTTLLFQCILPALLIAKRTSTLTLKGGTHVEWSPPFQYISEVFLPMVQKLGVDSRVLIRQYGWYPRGEGEIIALVNPATEIEAFDFTQRGELKEIHGKSFSSNLPYHIPERQRNRVMGLMETHGYDISFTTTEAPAISAGTGSFLFVRYENSMVGFTILGRRGKRAEQVAEEIVSEFMEFDRSEGVIDPYMADQLVLYAIMANGPCRFKTHRISQHLTTNLWVCKQFLPDLEFEIQGEVEEPGIVEIRPTGIEFAAAL